MTLEEHDQKENSVRLNRWEEQCIACRIQRSQSAKISFKVMIVLDLVSTSVSRV